MPPAFKLVPVDGPANSVNDLLKALEGFDQRILSVLQDMKLNSLDHIPQKTQKLWNDSTTTYPHLFPSNECWLRIPPTSSELILSTLDTFAAQSQNQPGNFNVYRRGEFSDVDPRTAIAQLSSPNSTAAVVIAGLRVKNLPDNILTTPEALSEFVEPYEHSNHQLLLTPKFAHTDIHIDSGDGLSVPMGCSEKIWLCFPPTHHNLELLSSVEGRKATLVRIGRSLEGGVIFRTTAEDAVYLPVGCLHTVFTLVGGFINTLDFVTMESSKTFAAMFSSGFNQPNGSSVFETECFDRFIASIGLAVSHKGVAGAVLAWLDAFERIRDYAAGDKVWRREATKVWDRFLATDSAKKLVCPCGARESFPEHFRAEHLWEEGRKSCENVTREPNIGFSMKLRVRRKRYLEHDEVKGLAKKMKKS
ncbi:hypothetical protein LAWI1_G002569 [Lachnellula willkommii]|uniref:JmjC domain-containing protein n=1 Tax=Lachnellula willkommii TaxID=215461 RepID=A0A559MF86_9HELO|nr:hypothetical protein LAWI1_G002569 [Lachnellula willkommii]